MLAGPAARPSALVCGVLVRTEPVNPLPSGLLAELGVELLEARVCRRHLQGSSGKPFLAGVVDVVVAGVDLVGAVARVPTRTEMPSEAAHVHLPRVPLRLAVDDPL